MRLKIPILLGLTFLLTFAKPLTTRAISSSHLANGKILVVRGEVYILRGNGRRIRPIPGTPLYPRDRLQTSADSEIRLQCEDSSFISVAQRETQANRCELASETKCTPELARCPIRGDELAWSNRAIPYIISPRRTLIATPTPVLRWSAVPGATEYTVSISGTNFQVKTRETQIQYSGEPLKPGGNYQLVVEADTGASSLDEPLKVGSLQFKLLDAESTALLETAKAQIAQQSLDELANAIAMVQLYLKYGLTADAIATVERAIANHPENIPLHRLLGDLYLQHLRLPPQAREPYRQAVERANPDDLEEQTAALDGLGQTEAALGNIPEAIRWLTQATTGYETLGNRDRAEQLQRKIKELSRLRSP